MDGAADMSTVIHLHNRLSFDVRVPDGDGFVVRVVGTWTKEGWVISIPDRGRGAQLGDFITHHPNYIAEKFRCSVEEAEDIANLLILAAEATGANEVSS